MYNLRDMPIALLGVFYTWPIWHSQYLFKMVPFCRCEKRPKEVWPLSRSSGAEIYTLAMVLFPCLSIICLGNNTRKAAGSWKLEFYDGELSKEVATSPPEWVPQRMQDEPGNWNQESQLHFLLLITLPREASQLFPRRRQAERIFQNPSPCYKFRLQGRERGRRKEIVG